MQRGEKGGGEGKQFSGHEVREEFLRKSSISLYRLWGERAMKWKDLAALK